MRRDQPWRLGDPAGWSRRGGKELKQTLGGFGRGNWVAVLAGGLGSLGRVMASIQAGALQSLTSLLAVGLKGKTLVSGEQARLIPALRGPRGEGGNHSGVLGTTWTLVDKGVFVVRSKARRSSGTGSGM